MHKRAFFIVAALLIPQACDAPGGPVQGEQLPVLEAPEAGLDDPAAYEGYATRFFRDSRGNTFQIYLNQRDSRVVHVWGDAVNESAAFSVRDADGRPAPIVWGGSGAVAESDGGSRTMHHQLTVEAGQLEIGWFLLGTMRQERDFQYLEWHQRPYGDSAFILPELTALVASVERLPNEERGQHLSLLGAADVDELRARLEPRVTLLEGEDGWTVLVEHTSLDGRNRLTIRLAGDTDASSPTLRDGRASVQATSGERIELDVSVTTDSEALTPLGRERLFNVAFEDYYARQTRTADSLIDALGAEAAARDPRVLAVRRIERQVLGLELLSSEQKLMASMPNYATYFGRDQMMSALMLEPISSVDLQELVIASVLRKIDPAGNVSHEEALGGQAIREAAAEYSEHVRAWEESRESDPETAAQHLARARALVENPQTVRENYHMVDDDYQLAVLVDRYLSRPDVSAERKQRFLTEPTAGEESRLEALVRNLAFAAELARPYAEEPQPMNLVSFFRQDDQGWLPGSWRDSRAGYGNGRFAMDVNVVWVPKALSAVEGILEAVEVLGLSVQEAMSGLARDAPALESYLADPATLRAAIETWHSAHRHFQVRLEPDEIERRMNSLLGSVTDEEADFWRGQLSEDAADVRPISFLALALDADGQPIPAASTDPATQLFIEDFTEEILSGTADPATVLEMVNLFVRPYPVGLFIAGLGPVVANDAYAGPAVQARFSEDLYHSPRVVWGREVNLLLLGLARQIEAAYDSNGQPRDGSEPIRTYVEALRQALEISQEAVEASGLSHNELWSYRIDEGALRPVRYGTSSDIQLWNVTDLAVGFLLDRMHHP
jgi:hypothetical protein